MMNKSEEDYKMEILRLADMRFLGALIIGPVVSFVNLQAIMLDLKNFPEFWGPTWALIRLGAIPLCILAALVVRSEKYERFGDLACVLAGSYICVMLTYFSYQTGKTHSEYLNALPLVLIGAAIIPLRPLSFISIFSVVFLAVIYLSFSEKSGLSMGTFALEAYFVMAICSFFSFRTSRSQTYKAKINLEIELQNRQKEIDRLVKMEMLAKEADIKMEVNRQIAHDIRSPLTALNTIANQKDLNKSDIRDLLNDTIQRIQKIAMGLLHQKEMAPMANERKIHSLRAICEKVVSQKKLEFDLNRVDIRLESVEQDVHFPYETIELERVLSNVMNNAYEALGARRGVIDVYIRQHRQSYSISVSDNGMGLSRRARGKIGTYGFSTKLQDSRSGFGLGLYHAKQILDQWDGVLEIQSREGIGTVVSITLPLTTKSIQANNIRDHLADTV